jgi:hypothetical protein
VLFSQEFRSSTTASAANQAVTVDLSNVDVLDGASITMHNSGANQVNFPQISSPNSLWPYAADAIKKQLPPTSTDQDAAIAAWEYIAKHNFHYCSAGTNTGTSQTYSYDPVLLLNGFGFGCCDQTARELIWLWQSMGYQGRLAAMIFHTVPEVLYGGAWHMLDPDHEVYYLGEDNTTIASVADVIADPNLVARTADSSGHDPVGWLATDMAQLYAQNASSLHYYTTALYSNAALSMVLRAHEGFTLHSANVMPSAQFFDYGTAFWPKDVSYGEFDWDLSFGDSSWALRAYTTAKIDVFTDPSGTKYARQTTGDPGWLGYRGSSVFPILGLSVTTQVGPTDTVMFAYFSNDGSHWSAPVPFQSVSGVSSFQLSADLSTFAKGNYTYYVLIQLNAGGLHKVHINSVVQTAKGLFPKLSAGLSNQLYYTDSSTFKGRALQVTTSVPTANLRIRGLQAESLVPENPIYSLGRDYGAANLVDADPDSLAYPASNHIDYVIHLGGPHAVTGASIDWGYFGSDSRYVKDWTVQGRVGTQDWQTLASGEFPGQSTTDLPMNIVATDVRIIADGFNNLGIYDIRLFGTEMPSVSSATLTAVSNVVENPTYSLASGYGAANLVDGNVGTLAYPAANNIDYQISLGQPMHLSTCTITWGIFGSQSNYVSTWMLLGRGGPGQPWTVLTQGAFPNSASTSVAFDTVATDLRVVARAAKDNIGIYEVHLFGVPVNGFPPMGGISASSNLAEVTSLASYGPSSNLLDGNLTTLAYPAKLNIDYSLDPGRDTYVDSVRVVWGYFGTIPIYVTSWQLLGQTTGSTTWDVISRGGYPNASESTIPVKNRYRKLRIAAQSLFNDFGIYEVQVFGVSQ